MLMLKIVMTILLIIFLEWRMTVTTPYENVQRRIGIVSIGPGQKASILLVIIIMIAVIWTL